MKVNYQKLIGDYRQLGVARGDELLRENLQEKVFRPGDFTFAELFIECFGWHEFDRHRRDRSLLLNQLFEQAELSEAGAVSTAAFQNISGQIVYTAFMDDYTSEEFVFTKLIPEMQSEFLHPEKLPDITEIGDEALVVPEGDPYPLVGVSEDWQHAPGVQKRGMICPLTKEAIFNDRTNGRLLEKCGKTAHWLGVNVEKRGIDCLIDENGGAKSALQNGHRYHWRDTSIQSYDDNTGNHTWDNLVATNALVDWTDVDNAEQALNGMTDPNTGEPVEADGVDLVCTKQLEKTALRIRNATEITVVTPGYATSGNPTETRLNNPYGGKFNVWCTRLLAARLATDTSWFFGDIKRAVKRKMVWPMQPQEAPGNSHDEFHRDIVRQFKISEASGFFWFQPRAMVKNTA